MVHAFSYIYQYLHENIHTWETSLKSLTWVTYAPTWSLIVFHFFIPSTPALQLHWEFLPIFPLPFFYLLSQSASHGAIIETITLPSISFPWPLQMNLPWLHPVAFLFPFNPRLRHLIMHFIYLLMTCLLSVSFFTVSFCAQELYGVHFCICSNENSAQ